MDIQPKAQQSISDDQELAKVLAGVNDQNDNDASGLQFEESPAMTIPTPPAPVDDQTAATDDDKVADTTPAEAELNIPAPTFAAPSSNNLDSIKQDALNELRPLVDKLDVSPEEKFDTYLLLLRSTDDRDLIGPAHESARAIVDESRRAQALLDIIKEIDYLSNPQTPAAN